MKGERAGLRRLETLIGYALRRTQAAVSRRFVESFSELDIRPTQLGILSVLEESPGLKPSRLAALLGMERTNIGALLDGLEARGLIRREPSADDRRSLRLFLGPAGRELLAEAHRRETAHEARIAGRLDPEERAELLRLLRRVEEAASGDSGDLGESAP